MNKKVIIKIVAIVCAVLICLSFVYFHSLTNVTREGLTAIEGKTIADDIAYEWNSSALLGSVRTIEYAKLDGLSDYWIYGYLNPYNYSYFVDITVFASGETEVKHYNISLNVSYDASKWNWNIDSDDAYDIIISDPTIKQFKSKYGVGSLEFSLGGSNPYWYVSLHASRLFDDPKSAEIQIDATTGEVLYVEVDD